MYWPKLQHCGIAVPEADSENTKQATNEETRDGTSARREWAISEDAPEGCVAS